MSMLNAGLPQIAAPVGVPKLVTIITSGTGTFIPLPGSTWRRERLYGGGGGGGGSHSSAIGSPGENGATSDAWIKNDGLSKSYAVGAAGTGGTNGAVPTAGTAGGSTVLGSTSAPGGAGGLAGVNQSGTLTTVALRGGPSPFRGYARGGDGAGGVPTGGVIVIEEY